MADNRKYYYLKLKENFFDSDSIAVSYTHLAKKCRDKKQDRNNGSHC